MKYECPKHHYASNEHNCPYCADVSESRSPACVLPNWVALYHAVNNMLAMLGADGEINATQDEVCDVFTALEPIDGGQYDTEMKA